MIGVQARSTSSRLPRKHHEIVGNKRMLDHVLDACQSARQYVNSKSSVEQAFVVLLTPTGDAIGEDFARNDTHIFYGSELDVLDRYMQASAHHRASHIVRITGDCPLVPPFMVSKMVMLGLSANYDYLSNVDHRCRSAIDGTDVEFMSERLLTWLDHYSKDREHVTILARESPPPWARVGFVGHYFDLSDVKLSVDTAEDLEKVRNCFDASQDKYREALKYYNKKNIHRM